MASTMGMGLHRGFGPPSKLRVVPSLNATSLKDVLLGNISLKSPSINIVHSHVKGLPAILISDKSMDKLVKPFALSLIRKFSYYSPNMDRIRDFFHFLKLSGSFFVSLIYAHYILFKLENDLDYSKFFVRRSYYVLNCQM